VLTLARMSSNDIHGIEKGWTVKTADGSSIGSVEETTDTYIEVKSGLINTSHRYLPAAVLEHVRPEVSEIGIELTQEEVEQGDWSQPPLEPPRASGAPLNAEEYSDDNAINGEVREPERPVKY
jgi:hypothetical protein